MARNSIYYGKRATVDQMTEARLHCGKDAVLVAKLDNLLNKKPNDRIMRKFIDYVRDPNRNEGRFAVEQGIRIACTDRRENTMKPTEITMDSVVCPACAVTIAKNNEGCPDCGYIFADTAHGRIGSLREMMAAQSEFNNVSPAFLRLLARAAAAAS